MTQYDADLHGWFGGSGSFGGRFMPEALVAAFSYDDRVLLERHVDGRELADGSGANVNNTLEMALIAIDSAGKVHAATSRAISPS
mgnify:CR=1 FL=1